MDMTFEVRPYEEGRWTDPETPPEARRSSGLFRAGRAGASRYTRATGHQQGGPAATWKVTLELLDAETRHLGRDGPVIIQAGFAEWDLRLDRSGPLRRVAESHPGVVVSFGSSFGPQRYATDTYAQKFAGDLPGWQANVRAVTLTLEALRSIDRWGVSRRGQQYTGFLALPPPGGLTFASADDALRWMRGHTPKGFLGDTTRELYRHLARRMHGDTPGSDPDDWERLQAARLLLEKEGML